MRNIFRTISALIILLVSFSHHAFSQGDKSRYENMVIEAVELINASENVKAEAVLRQIVKEAPEVDAAWYYLSQLALQNNDLEEAEDCLKKAVALDSQNYWYRFGLAKLYSHTSREELAIDMYERLLDDFPKESDLYFDLVEFYVSQREYQKALDTIEEIEKTIGVSESIAVYRFNLLRILDRQEEAYESLKQYNSKYSSPFVLSTLADYEMSMYNDSTALAYYDEALGLASDYAPALLGKAEAYRVTRRYQEYFPVLYRYAQIKEIPSQSKTEYLMAVIQRSDPKFVRSFQPQLDTVVQKTLAAHPEDSTAMQSAALYYYATNRSSEAIEMFKDIVDLYPDSFAANVDYVEFLMYAQKWEELSKEGRAAFERFQDETAFLEMASVGDYNLGDYKSVLDLCKQVLKVAPADSSATLRSYSTMGDVYYRLGESKNAFKSYKKALKINPDYVYVLNNYAYYLSQEGKKLKKAYVMSKKTIEAEPDNPTYLDTYGWILYLQGKAADAKPVFKHAMLYGGKDSAVILDHYAEVLYALEEYDLAFVYWNLSLQKHDERIEGLEEKIRKRREAVKK